jgi:hypothetical protein
MPFAEYKDFADCVAKNSDKKDPQAYCGTIKAAAEGSGLKPGIIEDFRAIDQFDLNESEFSVEEADDGKKKLVANVRLIKSGLSKNRRNYRATALKESVDKGIWNGVRMFANHSKTVPLQRPMQEMVAAVESTSWDSKAESVEAKVVFFNKDFYEFAERAKEYMGDSINALVQGTRTRDNRGQVTEDIHRIVQPHSVDFVIYPAAGGMIHSFEGEGDMIDWSSITSKDIKENAAALYDAIKAEVIAETPPPDPPKDPEPTASALTQEQINGQIKAAIEAHDKEVAETNRKIAVVNEKMLSAFSKSGLPLATQKRVMNSFEGVTEFDEEAVKESIEAAKEELVAVGAGPHITGQGPSGAAGSSSAKSFSVNESIAGAFGMKPAKKEGDK